MKIAHGASLTLCIALTLMSGLTLRRYSHGKQLMVRYGIQVLWARWPRACLRHTGPAISRLTNVGRHDAPAISGLDIGSSKPMPE